MDNQSQLTPDEARASLGTVTNLLEQHLGQISPQEQLQQHPPQTPESAPQQPEAETTKEEKKETPKVEMDEINKKIDILTNLVSSLVKEEKQETNTNVPPETAPPVQQ